MGVSLIVFLAIFLILLSKSMHTLQAYERVIIFRLGEFDGVKGPGLVTTIPFMDKIIKIKLGEDGDALSDIDTYKGKISLNGKDFDAVSEDKIKKGEKVKIVGTEEKKQFVSSKEEKTFLIKVKKKEV
jgi:regulator of protease activity HflC (stomatin/prohibitin superfamily)